MVKTINSFMFIFLVVFAFSNVFANNITVSGVSLSGNNTSGTPHFIMVNFGLSWDNSWKTISRSDYASAAGATSSNSIGYVSDVGAASVCTLPIGATSTYTSNEGATSPYYVSSPGVVSGIGTYTSSSNAMSYDNPIIYVDNTAGLVPGMIVNVTSGTGEFAPGTYVLNVQSGYFEVSTNPIILLSGATVSGTISDYISSPVNTSSKSYISVISVAGLVVGMPVTVTSGSGEFPPGTYVSYIDTYNNTFDVSADPVSRLDDAVITAYNTIMTVPSTTRLIAGMHLTVTAGTGVFAEGTIVTGVFDATHFIISSVPVTPFSGTENVITGIQKYVSSPGATSSGNCIYVSNNAFLEAGMPVSVTSGTGSFPAGTIVTYVDGPNYFYVSAEPTIPLSNGAVITAFGNTITVSSNEWLVVDMPVSVTSGAGAFPPGTVVTEVMGNGTQFKVSAAPTSPLTGGATVVTAYGKTICVSSMTGLKVGMPVSVTSGIGAFPAGTKVIYIYWDNHHFIVDSLPSTPLTGGETVVTGSDDQITVGSTTGLNVGMRVAVTSGTGSFVPGTVVTEIIDGTHFKISDTPLTPLAGGTSVVTGYDGSAITVSSTSGLRLGMHLSVTSGTGIFAPGTVVTGVTDATHFTVSSAPTTALSNNAVVTGTDIKNWDAAWVFAKFKVRTNYVSSAGATGATGQTTITVSSTTGLRVGMPVKVTSGTGVLTDGTVVTEITDATHFKVSAAPTTALSGGASVVTGYTIWEHATLNQTGHTAPSGSTITPASDGMGAFIYRSADGSGTNTWTGAQLQWNYGTNNVPDAALIDIQVFAIEMVYVPQGTYYLGSGGSENGSFTDGSWVSGNTIPFQVSSESAITVSQSSGNLWCNTSNVYGGNYVSNIPAAFPKGYNAFYCMKTEIMQQQYVDFLNTLTYKQQYTRTTDANVGMYIYPNSSAGSYVFSANSYSNILYRNKIKISTSGVVTTTPAVYTSDYPYVACNWISYGDLSAYLDWSGLRPITELEFEKSCRGTLPPVRNEYAWGSINIKQSTGFTNSGLINEVSANGGNCNYSPNGTYYDGPIRVGAFATSNSTRESSGATFYGILEMSGNNFERVINVGFSEGTCFNGTHGNGTLNSIGNSDCNTWPGTSNNWQNNTGSGMRGGTFYPYNRQSPPSDLVNLWQVSDRYFACWTSSQHWMDYGGRGVRTAN